MEKERIEPGPDSKINRLKAGFLERWQKKRHPEVPGPPASQDTETAAQKPDVEKPKEEPTLTEKVTGFVLNAFVPKPAVQDRAVASEAPVPEVAVSEALGSQEVHKTTKKIGKRVLTFASNVLGEVRNLRGAEAIPKASAELSESTTHLKEELEELDKINPVEPQEDMAPPADWAETPPQKKRREGLGRTEEKEEKKVPAFAMAQMAILAIAGAGIFMATIESEHRKEHRILRQHRKKVAKFLVQHRQETDVQNRQLREQQLALNVQAQELKQLKAKSDQAMHRKERAAFVHQVSELTEEQAVITREVIDQTAGQQRPEMSLGKQGKKAEAEAHAAEIAHSAEVDIMAKALSGGAVAGGFAAQSTAASPAPKNATESQKLKTENTQQAILKKQPKKDTWVHAVVFTTIVIGTIVWLVLQVVIKG